MIIIISYVMLTMFKGLTTVVASRKRQLMSFIEIMKKNDYT